MLRSLNMAGAAAQLRSAATPSPKKKRSTPRAKKPRVDPDAPRRRSSRVRGIGPDGQAASLPDRVPEWVPPPPAHLRKEGPLPAKDVLWDDQEEQPASALLVSLRDVEQAPSFAENGAAKKSPVKGRKTSRGGGSSGGRAASVLTSLRIKTEDFVAKVVPQRVFSISVIPTSDVVCAVVGDKWGRLGFWRPHEAEEENQVVAFEPHARPIPAIAHVAGSPARVVTCSYDGSVRSLDVEKGVFDEVFGDDDYLLHYVDLTPDGRTAYVGTRAGSLLQIDLRAPKAFSEFEELHDRKLCNVHVNPTQPELVMTTSLDAAVHIWDARKLKKKSCKPVSTMEHAMAVTSAFFSPDGTRLVSTCNDNTLRVFDVNGGSAPKAGVVIRHNNHTGRWLSNFRTTWDPAASNTLLVGNMKRGIDVYDATSGASVGYLTDPELLSAVPTLNAVHPSLDVAVSSTASGRLYLWS